MFRAYYAVFLFAIAPILMWSGIMAWRRKHAPGEAFIIYHGKCFKIMLYASATLLRRLFAATSHGA